jgi:integrase
VELKEIDFAGFSERWFREYADGAVKLSTLAAYRPVVKNHLTPYFADVRLTGVSLEYVQGYVTEKREAGYAPKTIRNHIVILKEMFKHAVRWGYLRFNPALEVDLPRIPHREMDFLIPDEIRLFLETAKEVQPDHCVLFLAAVMTGMRRGELLAMKWRNVDWQRRQYFVKEAYYRGRFDQPKYERSRRPIDLTKTVCERLMDLYDAQKDIKKKGLYNDLDLIFCRRDGIPLDPDTVSKIEFHRILKSTGIRRIRFHDLRHTYAALLVAQGESPKCIQCQLGHSSIQVTLDRYGHLMPDVNEAAAARLEEQVFGPPIRKILEIGA